MLLGVLNEESPGRVSHWCNLTWFNLNFQGLISLLLLTLSAFFLYAEISRISCVVWLKDLGKKKKVWVIVGQDAIIGLKCRKKCWTGKQS